MISMTDALTIGQKWTFDDQRSFWLGMQDSETVLIISNILRLEVGQDKRLPVNTRPYRLCWLGLSPGRAQ